MEIEIIVFYHSEETLQSKNAGISYSVLECDTKARTFYEITSISEWEDNSGAMLCEIISGGADYIATKSYEEIKQMIHEAMRNER